MHIVQAVLLSILLCVMAKPVWAVSVTSEELSEAHRWVAAKLEGKRAAQPDEGYLMVYTRSGVVDKDGIDGYPFRLVDKAYRRGLCFPSVGRVAVHLPSAGESFEAIAGVDSNDLSYYSNAGRGAIIAVVEVSGKESFRSGVLREGMAGVPVRVDLQGARDFTLKVRGAGDGEDADRTDWAEARVRLADGRTIWPGELPVAPMHPAYTPEVPFSFRYGGQPSGELLKKWELERTVRKLGEQRTEDTLRYKDPKTGLVVRCVAVAYNDFPAVEWTVYFKNTGTRATPILEDIEALDTRLERNGEGEFVLHHSKGAPATPSDYQPFQTVLGPKAEQRLSAAGGRPTNKDMPYFNVAWPGEGVIIAVGWPGQWAAQLKRDEGNSLQVRAGQEFTHFKLLPGEEVRTPLIVMQFYKGDWLRAQNIWRRWMLAYNLPRPGGKLPPPQFAATSSHAYTEMQEANEENQKMFIDRYLAGGLKIDYWWMDAGWYVNNGSWVNTGTWEPDPKRFPHGLRAISDYAHSQGVNIVLWFEPERVTKGSWLYEQHPEWLLNLPPNPVHQADDKDWRLLNLGTPEARQWLTDHIDKLIREQGVDLYRQDFNIDPLDFWRANDAMDRQGITEIRYVTGYLAYWDELRHRHPHMLIDSCASGGRRNDLETMRRAVPLTRSDYLLQIEKGEPLSQQSQTYGMALWLPYFGTGINGLDAYTFRSQMCPALAGTWDLRSKEIPYDLLRRLLAQWRRIGEYYFGDYYPLTPYNLVADVWLAWQFDRPDLGEGMVQAFRRSNSSYESARFKLRGLDPEARYGVGDVDAPGAQGMTGRELMEHGLMVNVKDQPGAAIILYKRVEPGK